MAINLTPEEFLDLLDRYNTNVKGKSRKDLEKANEDLRNRIAQNVADKKFKGTGITPDLNRLKPDSFNSFFTWGERNNQVANTMDALQYTSSLDGGTAYPEDKLKFFADFMSKIDVPNEGLDDVMSDPVKVANAFDYYIQNGLPIQDFYGIHEYTPSGGVSADSPYSAYYIDIYNQGGVPSFGHYVRSKVLGNESEFSKQVREISKKPKAIQPSTPVETQEEVKEVSPVEQVVQNTPSTTATPATQELSNADWLADELRKSYRKDPRGFERLGTW